MNKNEILYWSDVVKKLDEIVYPIHYKKEVFKNTTIMVEINRILDKTAFPDITLSKVKEKLEEIKDKLDEVLNDEYYSGTDEWVFHQNLKMHLGLIFLRMKYSE